jgi:hypothetical protein
MVATARRFSSPFSTTDSSLAAPLPLTAGSLQLLRALFLFSSSSTFWRARTSSISSPKKKKKKKKGCKKG